MREEMKLGLLLVDDSEDILRTWCEFFETRGHRCFTASTFEAAESVALEPHTELDAALVDTVIELPKTADGDYMTWAEREGRNYDGGFHVARRLAELSSDVAVVMKTVHGLSQERLLDAVHFPNIYDYVDGGVSDDLESRLYSAVIMSRAHRSGPLNVLRGCSHRAIHLLEPGSRRLARATSFLASVEGGESLLADLTAHQTDVTRAVTLLRRAAYVGQGTSLPASDMCAQQLREVLLSAVSYVHEMTGRDTRDTQVQCVCAERLYVRADRDFLREALIVLIENGHDAMESVTGGEITVRAEQSEDGKAIIRIQDAGVGIAEEDQRRLFRPFFTTRQKRGGMGLGLCFAWNVIRQHGGILDLEKSTPGEGTTFIIELPLEARGGRDDE